MSDLAERIALQRQVDAEARAAGYLIPYCPNIPFPKQRRFVLLPTREAMYGGAAGGGKSDALLMAALLYVDRPAYSALILRRTYTDLALAGSIMDRAASWLRQTDATWNDRDKRWTFPSGARLTFGYLETEADRYRYQGAEFQFIAFDELTQFTELSYTYMMSRLRKLEGSDIPVRMRAATNPGGVGHHWVKQRFVDPGSPERPFIPANLDDNPALAGSDYRLSLAALDETTRAQLEHGLWIQDDSQRVYRYDPSTDVDALPSVPTDPTSGLWERCMVLDLGSSERSPTTGFAIVVWHPHIRTTFCERSWKEATPDYSTLVQRIERERATYGDTLRIVIDEGGLGGLFSRELRTRHDLPVFAAEKKEKLAHRRLMNGALQRGELRLVRGQCDALAAELLTLVYDDKGLDVAKGLADHASDALLYGWRYSQSYASAAPDRAPAYQSPEWWAQREQEQLAREREAIRSQLDDEAILYGDGP